MTSLLPDDPRYPVLDHLRVAGKMLRLIEHLAHGPNSCDHRLVQSYALKALSHIQAAERKLNPEAGGSESGGKR